ncbi:MAG: hypothetical protein HGA75_02990 [Thiobacillus sp.]|nr:hypothetical protein [Thiobacillus sp.]
MAAPPINKIGEPEVEAFLTSQATERNVAATTQNLALSAILFLYQEVLEMPLPWLTEMTRAKKAARLSTVLNRDEVAGLLAHVKLGLMGALLFPVNAFAFGVILQYQGEVDDRELYFADVRTISNRTPPDQIMGPTEIREIGVTAVYENANKPEFVHMKLQFQCPNAYTMDMAKFKLTENKTKVRAGDAVTFRIGPGSYKLRRSDLQSEPVAASDWKTSNAPMLSKAGAIACNHIEFDQALHAAIKGDTFDFDGFGKRIGKLGLPEDMALIGQVLPSEFLDFAWSDFWWDKVSAGKRPDPSGKWAKPLSEADKQAAIKKLKDQQQALLSATASAKASLMEGIKRSKADMEAARNAGRRADGPRMTKTESNLMMLWSGRPERDVINTMGNPEFNQVGDTRFLRYTHSWEKAGFIAYNGQGMAVGGEVGGYAMCFVEFRVRKDANGEWRVDDILVRSDYEDAGLGRTRGLCDELARKAAGS